MAGIGEKRDGVREDAEAHLDDDIRDVQRGADGEGGAEILWHVRMSVLVVVACSHA